MRFVNVALTTMMTIMALMFAEPLWATGEDVRGARSEDGTDLEADGSQLLFMKAIVDDNVEAVKAELKKGVDVNKEISRALLSQVTGGVLLSKIKADIADIKDVDIEGLGHTFALFEAVYQRAIRGGTNLEIIKLLLEAGAETNRRSQSAPLQLSSLDGLTPLHLTVKFNRDDIAELLLQHGADPNFRSSLLDCGACVLYENCDPKACDHAARGYSPMHCVVYGPECLFRTDIGIDGDDSPLHQIAESIGMLAVNVVWEEGLLPPAKARRHIYKWMDLFVRYGGNIHDAQPYSTRGGVLGSDDLMLLFRPVFYWRYRRSRYQSADRAHPSCRRMLNK